MFVWSKRLVTGLLAGFVLLIGLFLLQGEAESVSGLYDPHDPLDGRITSDCWSGSSFGCSIKPGYAGKNVVVWLVLPALAPLPTLMLFVLFLQRKVR
ncbi:MAG: hypothetical protein MRJ92_04980 [Nitrospira sp.]|nr:hypothetical protein [Nitrospira sp.]